MKVELNEKNVYTLLPRNGKDRELFLDGTEVKTEAKRIPRGFGLRVSTRGAEVSRTFVLRYRVAGVTAARLLRLGDVSMGLGNARQKARDARDRVDKGEDPAAARKHERERTVAAGTFGLVVADYIAAGKEGRSAGTNREYERQLVRLTGREKTSRKPARPASPLGKRLARTVTAADVADFLATIAAPVESNRMLALLKAACHWACSPARKRLDGDPAVALERREEKPRRERLEGEGIKLLWIALDATLDKPRREGAVRIVPLEVAGAVRVLLLLGTRKTETLRMKWENIQGLDTFAPTWEVPGTDRKGGHALVVPLAPEAAAIIKAMRPVTGERAYVFAGANGAPLTANPDRWLKAIRAAGGPSFALHSLRRTAARGWARLGVGSELISRMLGHRLAAGTLEVSENYSEYDFLKERRAALESWARHVLGVVAGEERQGADVVPIGARA